MDLYTIIFYVFAILVVVAASIVVVSRNIVRAAFALLFTFFGVAGIYVFLLADFIAVTQLLIYVGGILVLILFGVMLTNRQINVDVNTGNIHAFPAVIISALLLSILVRIFYSTNWSINPQLMTLDKTTPQIGELLLTDYLLPFETASIILLVALVGAAMIARREKKV